jgi:hypothetical protein
MMVRARVVLLALLAPAVARAQPASRPASQPTSQPTSRPTSQPVRALPDWAPRINATVKPAVAQLGDPVQVTLKVRHRKGVSANLPLHLELGKFSELSRSDASREIRAKEEGGFPEVERTFVLRVAAYELGELTLPPVEVTALGPGGELISLKTEPLPIKIQSVLRNEPDPRPRDLEPPVPVYQRTWWLIYTLAALVLVVATVIITLVVRSHLRTRRERMKPPPPPVPAHVIALERLGAIDVEAYIEEERFKELYLLLSEIMRQYVGRLWGFDAPEMTTSEVDEAMERASVQLETRRRFVEAFDGWDLVKFAKYRPEADAARQAVADAAQMVRSTSLVAAPKPGPRPGGGDG